VQIIRFLLVGLCNTAIGLFCIFMAMWLFKIDYRVANAIGYLVGGILGFLLNRSWTFQYEGSWWKSSARWLAVVVVSFGLNLCMVIVLHQGLHVDAYVAQLAGIAVYTTFSYLGGRFFAFGISRSKMVEAAQ
jgi:putative flippase GtrA